MGDEKEMVYLIEEFAENGTLSDLIHQLHLLRGGVSESLAAFLFHGILSGVRSMHERDFVHLDLKPESIYLDSDLQPKIGGFSNMKKTMGHRVKTQK